MAGNKVTLAKCKVECYDQRPVGKLKSFFATFLIDLSILGIPKVVLFSRNVFGTHESESLYSNSNVESTLNLLT